MKTHISRIGQLAGMKMMLEMMEAMMMMTSSAQELKPDLAAGLLIPVIRAVIRGDTGGCEIVALVWVTYPPAMHPRAGPLVPHTPPIAILQINNRAGTFFTFGGNAVRFYAEVRVHFATKKWSFLFQMV